MHDTSRVIYLWKRFLLLSLAWMTISSGCMAERWFFEAEEMTTDKTWKAVEHFEGWYTGAPSGGKTLWGSETGVQGVARQTVKVTHDGGYKLWLRYLDCRYRAPFTVMLKQGGIVIAQQTFDQQSLRETDEGKAKWGNAYSVFVWQSIPVTLTAGDVEVLLTKAEPFVCSWITRYIDCFVLTDDLTYEPKVTDFLAPLYIKVKMGAKQQQPCVIHLFGRLPRAPWYCAHSNIYRDRFSTPEAFISPRYVKDGANPGYLTADTESPWVNIAPLLDVVGDNHIDFFATQAYYPCLASADFSLLVSKTPSETGLMHTFSRSGSGGGISLVIDLNRRENIKSDLEYSREAAAIAAKLPPVPGKRPNRFPIMTENGVTSSFYQPETVKNEMNIMAALGLSGIGGYDPLYFANGSTHYLSGSPSFHLAKGGCLSNPDTAAIRARAQEDARNELKRGMLKHVVAWNQMDEPGSVSLEHMTSCPFCAGKFRKYVQELGLKPATFGKTTWDEIVPTLDREHKPELYYYSARCRAQIISDFFKIGTTAITELIPDARTMADLGEDLTWHGNALKYGVDWFEVQAQDALRYGWTENGLAFATSYQLCGYRTDFLRASSNLAGHGFGVYSQFKSPWDTSVNIPTLIGHGAQAIYYYNYGPYYTASTDQCSLAYELYPAMRATNYAIGAVEDYLIDARVPKSKIGLLYSPTTDIWTLNENISIFGKEQQGLYLILRHLGYPIDFVTEQQVIEGKLGSYQAVFLLGSHLQRQALTPLVNWVRGGGLLYIGAGALQRDEFNRPLQGDEQLGLSRQPFVLKDHPAPERLEMLSLAPIDTVTYGKFKLDAFCGVQKGSGEGSIATFADGTPALRIFTVGKGTVACCGFFPGVAYSRSAVQQYKADEAAAKKDGKAITTYNPAEYPAGHRALVATLMAKVAFKPIVSTSAYLVEANLLQGPKGLIITLSNWSGKPVSNLRVIVTTNAKLGKPVTAINPVKMVKRISGRIEIQLDLGPSDFLVLPYAR